MIWINPFRSEKRWGKPHGFSLLEMLVVLGLMALMAAFVVPSVSSYFSLSLNSATRDLASVIKETFNSAVVSGRVHRVVYDLNSGQYWAEVGPKDVLLDTKESTEISDRRRRFGIQAKADRTSSFQQETTISRKKKSLPTGVKFVDLQTQQHPDPIVDSLAYTHFFPSGLAEQTVIHLKDTSEHQITLDISAMLGTTNLSEGYVHASEIFKR